MERRDFIRIAAAGIAATSPVAASWAASTKNTRKIELFAHRGASALRPEHTLAAYAKAIADGADFIEPDLVMTKDGVMVARHEGLLTETTDVARRPEFAARRVSKTIDGITETGWFVEDFTLAELKTLRAVERLPAIRKDNTRYDGFFQVLTWDEIIDFAATVEATTGKTIGLIPEIKHSSYFASIGLPMEDAFLKSIDAHEYTRRCPLVIQSFEISNLKYIRSKIGKTPHIRLMQLIDDPKVRPGDVLAQNGATSYMDMLSTSGLREIARYADILSPNHRVYVPQDKSGKLLKPTRVIADAKDAGLQTHSWTFRPENCFLALDFRNDAGANERNEKGSLAEMQFYMEAGVEGFFSDDSALGRKAIQSFVAT